MQTLMLVKLDNINILNNITHRFYRIFCRMWSQGFQNKFKNSRQDSLSLFSLLITLESKLFKRRLVQITLFAMWQSNLFANRRVSDRWQTLKCHQRVQQDLTIDTRESFAFTFGNKIANTELFHNENKTTIDTGCLLIFSIPVTFHSEQIRKRRSKSTGVRTSTNGDRVPPCYPPSWLWATRSRVRKCTILMHAPRASILRQSR